ncbi:outer membrane protein transport protein [Rhodoblastus acidophilus]|uniref:Outer membrane protein transport protein n=1 Tax=Candidatus Rhodoblastus alkanivorans TaxID=2954117 RepID=A0ABS9Z9K9_9HYPH|nr:outer membrane protein transport protein [Candidatus Rhodoblastus alkanivorans]MCI4684373.1 outer membrane protein transport protein [Candidatus Rhodoblastus alkanivorans]
MGANLAALVLTAATAAHATEGYFVEGESARQQSLAGAGSANPATALSIAVNPASLVDVGRQFNGDISAFMPWRGYDATGTMLTAPGSVDSYRNVFPIPAIGYSQPINADSSFGFAMVGNGGMNTTFSSGTINPACAQFGSPLQGVFCGGRAGVDLNQALIYAGYAQRFGNLSFGIAPVLGVQIFSAYGIGAFSMFGLSSNPMNVSDHSPAYSVGGGVRAGMLYHVTPDFSLSVQGSTPIWSTPFHDYSGLFAGGGSFDVPATIGAGISYKLLPTLAMMIDYKHIFYSLVPSISNPMAPILPASLGTANGPGFGWKDVDVIAIGFEWMYNDRLTLRAGYSYSSQPVTAANVMLNILAPGVVTNHIGGGFTYKWTHNSDIDFSALYSPRTSVSGQEYVPGFGYNPYSNINVWLEELEVTIGYTYHWDQPAPVLAKY